MNFLYLNFLRVNQFIKKISRLIAFSVVFTQAACQTFDSSKIEKEKAVLQTQLDIAASQLDQGAPEKSLHTLLPLKEKYPNHPDLITLLGMSHLSLGNHAVALQMLRHAYKLRPDIRSGLNLSSGLIADKQYARALNVTRKLMKRDEPYRFKERIYHNHAVALERSGRIKPAIIHYNKALEVNPIFYMSLMGLGKIHQSIQDLEKAQKFFIKANKSCQSCFEPVKQLAQLLINQGKRSTAQKLLQEYIDQPAVVQADQNSAQQLLKIASNAGRARDKRR